MSDRLADKAGLGIWRAGSHCVERQLGSKTLFQTCFLQTGVEAAAAAAALPSSHTDNMAAAEEETHGSAASRRDQIGRAHV